MGKYNDWVRGENEAILLPHDKVNVRPVTKFIAREFFKLNTKNNAAVRISNIGDKFANWFLDKIEEQATSVSMSSDGPYRTLGQNSNSVMLRYHTLNKDSLDTSIIAALGGEDKAEMPLAMVAALLTRQADGKRGPLHTNCFSNIFYVRDVNSVLRVVDAHWNGYSWCVDADSIKHPSGWWQAADRVFSRDF